MQQTVTEQYNQIKPLIQQQIEAAIKSARSSTVAGSSGISLANYLLKSGDTISGDIAVAVGKKIDGYDINVSFDDIYAQLAATEAFAHSGLGLSHTDDGTTYTLILSSSSYPGAAASILASDASGRLGVQNLGLGIAAQTGYALYSNVANPSYFANDLRVGTSAAGTMAARLHVLTTGTQAQFSYDANNYGFLAVSSSGAMTLGNTGTTPANAHLYLNPGGGAGKIGIGNSIPTPTAKLEVNSTTEQLRLAYSGAVYATFTVSSPGDLTINTTGANIYTSEHVGHPNYVSQTTAWRMSSAGELDVRYLYTDELHAKSFIADLEQALAGSQWLGKSVAPIYATITLPTAGNTANLDVEEFAGFPGFHVFVDGDLVRLRQFNRSGGLTIADAWGTVVYSAQVAGSNPPAQRYVFTRHATYPGTATSTVNAKVLVLDYGTSGNGYLEQNAIDGANGSNSPYHQIVTWNTHPKSVVAGQGLQVRLRMGQLRGLTGVSQYGIYAGTGWTAQPNEGNVAQYTVTTPTVDNNHRYILAGDNGVNIYNADLAIYSSTTQVITLSRTAPSIAVGSGSDTMTYSAGAAGYWVGNDSGTYKMRLGSVSGGALTQGLSWDGSRLNVIGNVSLGPSASLNYGPSIAAPLLVGRFDGDSTAHDGTPAAITGGVAYVRGKFGLAASVAQATTNLITNPSFEVNLLGWTATTGGSTMSGARSALQYLWGSYCLRITNSTSTADAFYEFSISGVAASTVYSISVWVNCTSFTAGAIGNRCLAAYDSANVGTTFTASTITASTNGWVRHTITCTTTASPGTLRVRLYSPNGTIHYDGVQAEQKTAPTPYCDGSLGPAHSWSGTANASTSSRTAAVINYTKSTSLHVRGSVAAWVRLSNTSGIHTAFRIDSTGSNLIILRTNGTAANAYWGLSGGVVSAGTVAAGAWYHLAMTFDGATLTLYVNGVSVGSGVQTNFSSTDSVFRVGAFSAGTESLDGELDDLIVTDAVLNADEIEAIFNSNAPVAVESSPFSLYLYGNGSAGYVRGNSTGLFGYSDTTGGAGTGAFALVTTASTALGTPFGGLTQGAGDMIIGPGASAGKSSLRYTASLGQLGIYTANVEKVRIDSTGTVQIGENIGSGSGNRLVFDSSTGVFSVNNGFIKRIEMSSAGVFSINDSSGNPQITMDGSGNATIADTLTMGASGSINVGSSDVILDNTGIAIKSVSAYADINALKWKSGAVNVATLWSIIDTGATVSSTLNIHSKPYSGGTYGFLDIVAESSSGAATRLLLDGTPNNATRGPAATYTFYNTSLTKIAGVVKHASTAATSATATVSSAVRYRLNYTVVVRANTSGNLQTLTGNVAVNASVTATVGTAGSDFKVGVDATGAIYWQRVAGTETYDVLLVGNYI